MGPGSWVCEQELPFGPALGLLALLRPACLPAACGRFCCQNKTIYAFVLRAIGITRHSPTPSKGELWPGSESEIGDRESGGPHVDVDVCSIDGSCIRCHHWPPLAALATFNDCSN